MEVTGEERGGNPDKGLRPEKVRGCCVGDRVYALRKKHEMVPS